MFGMKNPLTTSTYVIATSMYECIFQSLISEKNFDQMSQAQHLMLIVAITSNIDSSYRGLISSMILVQSHENLSVT